MFEDAEVDGPLVWLDAPGDGVVAFDIDPSDEVGLSISNRIRICIPKVSVEGYVVGNYLAVNLELFHSRHAEQTLSSVKQVGGVKLLNYLQAIDICQCSDYCHESKK